MQYSSCFKISEYNLYYESTAHNYSFINSIFKRYIRRICKHVASDTYPARHFYYRLRKNKGRKCSKNILNTKMYIVKVKLTFINM